MDRRRLMVGGAVLLCAAGLGAWAWLRARAEEERAYGDIDRSAYEAWMQDLGYTE